MQFSDVESKRENYHSKCLELSKKRKKVFCIVLAVILVIELLALIVNFGNISKLFSSDQSSAAVIFAVMFVFIVLIVDLTIAALIAFFVTNYAGSADADYVAYKKAYKAYFIAKQLANLFTDVKYNHEQGLNKEILASTKLINTGDIYKSNDLVTAKYKNVNFLQADVCIENIRKEKDEDGHIIERIYPIFKGRYLIFEFPKKFDFKMVVSPQDYDGAYVNPKTGKGLNLIETESTNFNKRFLVCAEDGFEAFYILNPSFIENLEKLGEKYHDHLALYFSDNKLFIGLNDNNDSFEPPNPAAPINEKEERAKVIDDMKLITDIVDDLKLYNK